MTLIFLLSRKSSTHGIILPLIPREISASKMTIWSALSKALSKSRKAVQTVLDQIFFLLLTKCRIGSGELKY